MNLHKPNSLKRIVLAAGAALLAATAAVALPTSAQAAGTGQLSITNPDTLPGNSALMMNRIGTLADSSQRVHDKVVIKLKNTGTAGLSVSSIGTTGPFTITSPWKLPFTLSTGSSVDFTVAFTATSGTWNSGKATINWNNGSARTSELSLTGWFQKYSEHNLEPWLPDLVRNLGYGTVMPTAIYSRGEYQTFSSDEVLSPYWTALDSTQPARITHLAAWRGYPTNVVVRTFPKGSSSQTAQVFSGLKNDAQSAFPRNTNWNRGTATFALGSSTGLKIDDEFSDPKLNPDKVDRTAGCTATVCGHHLRVWKARTPAGAVIAGSYLIAEDFGGINYDYNDNVFLLENVKPA